MIENQVYKIGTLATLRMGNTDNVVGAMILGHKECEALRDPIYLMKIAGRDVVCRAVHDINNHKYRIEADLITTAAMPYGEGQKVANMEQAVSMLF